MIDHDRETGKKMVPPQDDPSVINPLDGGSPFASQVNAGMGGSGLIIDDTPSAECPLDFTRDRF